MTELAAWYQKKIGTYDKQEWETTIEQRILQGLHNVPLKSAKLKPDLIDVDLIRGSSFPKAKPVQGLATVVRLALLRVFLFPFWKHWWAIHTSPPATRAFFSLWILQVVNTILFLIAPSSSNIDSSCILVPLSLMAGLGIVHAFIVSTAHPHLNNIRCRGHERRRPCLLTSGTQDGEIFRKANVPPNEVFHSTDVSNVKEFVSVVSKSTQTQITGNDVEINSKKWSEGFLIPKVSLTPPAHQSVKFNLSSISLKNRETSGEDDDSPVLRQRQRNINPRVARISAEGDDGFESLNGNNSNGSENGDDIVKFEDQPTQKHDEAVKSPANEDNPDLILFEDKLTKRLNAKDPIHKETKYWNKDGKEDESMINGNTVKFKCDTQVCSDGGSSTNLSGDNGHCETNDRFRSNWFKFIEKSGSRSEGRCRKSRKDRESNITSSSDEECDTASASLGVPSQHADFAQTTNSEECSYCSEPDESESEGLEGDSAWEPFAILNPASERVSCTVWENGRVRKAQMSVMDISEAVVKRADQVLNRNDSALWPGIIIATTLATLLPATRLLQILVEIGNDQVTVWDLPYVFLTNSPFQLIYNAFGANIWECVINFFSALLRLGLGSVVFFLLAVAQRAFNQRFLYAKLFSHLTSARRARQSTLPHFRLNRVRNIKTWLSVRSYLMRRGPQRSVDIIVSSAFILLVLLISFLVIDLLQDQSQGDLSRTAETLGWAVALGAVLLRLVALGTRASRKHRCLPVLLTEQINLYLAMERRPASKDRLSVANNVLKLAADLLKELESPFKISGLSANPYLYTITKVVVLSALSGVLSDLLGFKLKLHKIKIK